MIDLTRTSAVVSSRQARGAPTMADGRREHERMANPPVDPNDPLSIYWNKTVGELADVENTRVSPEEAERHTIFSLLVMALVSDAFNGNKKGATGTYPGRVSQLVEPGRCKGDRFGDRYFGHNIACIAVDGRGEIIDFEFNHNELYNSSAEHAEARLVRRIFNLNQSFDHWQTVDPADHRRRLRHPAERGHALHVARILRAMLGHHDAREREERRLPAVGPGPIPDRRPHV
jgi:hypothetical protein